VSRHYARTRAVQPAQRAGPGRRALAVAAIALD